MARFKLLDATARHVNIVFLEGTKENTISEKKSEGTEKEVVE